MFSLSFVRLWGHPPDCGLFVGTGQCSLLDDTIVHCFGKPWPFRSTCYTISRPPGILSLAPNRLHSTVTGVRIKRTRRRSLGHSVSYVAQGTRECGTRQLYNGEIVPLIYDMANSAAGSTDLIFVVSPLGSWPALASVSQGITISTSM